MDKKSIYLDYAASAPVRDEIIELMCKIEREVIGNPSSIHFKGRESRSVIDRSRSDIAEILGCDEQEIYLTTGGTESDNLAILGMARKKGKGHIITTKIEHQAVMAACGQLEKEGFSISYIAPGENGTIDPEDVRKEIRDDTFLVSVMYVNNEIGTVQPIQQIGKMLEKIKENAGQRIYFHSDAVQAAGSFSLNVARQHLDAISLSAHKFGGPRGVGLLYLKKGIDIEPLFYGGVQELALRPGSENVSGIAGMAEALKLATKERYAGADKKIAEIRQYFEDQLLKNFPETLIIGSREERSPAITSAVFSGVDGSMLVMNLDLAGICVSSGAACSSGSLTISHVIDALNLKEPYNKGAVRFSFGRETKKEDLDLVIEEIKQILPRMRKK